jgi:putative redox protein
MEALMEVTVQHLGAVQFEIKARNHTINSDQPTEAGGFDEGMTPPEFLLASLGSCAAYYAVDYLKRSNLLVEGTKVVVKADKIKGVTPGVPYRGARLDNFTIEVQVPRELTEMQHKGVEDAVHRCIVHNTLMTPPKVELEVKVAVSA